MQCLGASGSSLSYYPFIPPAADIAAREPQIVGWRATGQTACRSGEGTAIKEMVRVMELSLCAAWMAVSSPPGFYLCFRFAFEVESAPRSLVTAFGNLYLAKVWIHGMTSITLGAAYIFLAHRTNFLA